MRVFLVAVVVVNIFGSVSLLHIHQMPHLTRETAHSTTDGPSNSFSSKTCYQCGNGISLFGWEFQ